MSPSESNPGQLFLRLQGGQPIRQAIDAARGFGEAQRLGNDDLARLCIVVEELVANLYDHGGVTGEDEVRLSLAVDPRGIRMSIIDPGRPFDPWSAQHVPENMGRGGGAGLGLIRAWAVLIGYRSSNDGNRLELLVPLKMDD